jgi:thiol:disulfide interchange protein DsbA
MRGLWRGAAMLLALACALTAPAAGAAPAGRAAAEPEEGFDYEVVRRAAALPQPGGGKVQVVEFFWYQCPYCAAMLHLIEPWARRQAGRIAFERVPMSLQKDSLRQVHFYYALAALGEAERLHPLIFQAIHDDRMELKTDAQMAEYLADEGVSRSRFLGALRTQRVRAQAERAKMLVAHYRVRETPMLLVDGRFLTSATHAGGTQADALRVAEWLVGRAERERRAGSRP